MEHIDPTDIAGDVLAVLRRPLPAGVVAGIARYVAQLIAANDRMNLTAVRDRHGIEHRHIAESLALLRLLEQRHALPAGSAVLDVGSGGGLPGLPIAIARPDVSVTLLEATGKKAAFLTETAAALGLSNVTVIAMRAEEAGRLPAYRERFDIVTARAVAVLATLAELTLPFARVGGWVLAVKGSRWPEELQEARAAITACGGDPKAVNPLATGADSPLVAVWLRKSRPAPAAYPRRSGLPGRQPLR